MGVKPGGADTMSRTADCLLYVILWIWNHPRMKYVRKLLYNFKLTVICGIITLLVFRGTVGAGKFGTIQDDIQQIASLELKPALVNKVIESPESRAFLWKESEEPAGPYKIGPTVTDWDFQREKFINADPGSNVTSSGQPLVMIVSGSPPTPCEYNVGDHLHVKFLKTKVDYARTKSMKIYYHMVRLDKEMTGLWSKLPLLRRLMVAYPEIEWFWWMDPDAVITDMKFDIPLEKYKDYNMVVPGWNELVYTEKDWVGLSTGSFLLRNCQWSLDLLEAWSKMGVKGKPRNEAGKVLTSVLKGRPDIPADDQSGLVYLMISDKKWGSKVHLESKYYLHGYWVNLVDKFERMMEKSSPGHGDDRWPFVVHFVGCQLCSVVGDYDVQKCLNQMGRAFNFADNQVIKAYGFKHLRLNSSIILPTNETTRVTIVETHYIRKKIQRTRKEKVGVKVMKDRLVSYGDLDRNETDALPPTTQRLVDELLAEGVLALAPGSSGSNGVSSLQVVPVKERIVQVNGSQEGGQSLAWTAGAGQTGADWRDNVEGIEEEELQEKKLEEAESSRLLQQEGKYLKEQEAAEAKAQGDEPEDVGTTPIVGTKVEDKVDVGSAMDRLQAQLEKGPEKSSVDVATENPAVTKESSPEEDVEGLDVVTRAAEEEKLDRVMRMKKSRVEKPATRIGAKSVSQQVQADSTKREVDGAEEEGETEEKEEGVDSGGGESDLGGTGSKHGSKSLSDAPLQSSAREGQLRRQQDISVMKDSASEEGEGEPNDETESEKGQPQLETGASTGDIVHGSRVHGSSATKAVVGGAAQLSGGIMGKSALPAETTEESDESYETSPKNQVSDGDEDGNPTVTERPASAGPGAHSESAGITRSTADAAEDTQGAETGLRSTNSYPLHVAQSNKFPSPEGDGDEDSGTAEGKSVPADTLMARDQAGETEAEE